MPGKGFFVMTQELGRSQPGESDYHVFSRELKAVHDYHAQI
jgi:hypothetical protein